MRFGPERTRVRLAQFFASGLEAQRGTAMLWAPVALGTGIGIYFGLPFEPATHWVAVLAVAGIGGLALATLIRLSPVALVALVSLGAALAAIQTEWHRAPVLDGSYRGPVVGRLIALDRSASNAVRITLDRVHLSGKAGDAVPEKVRISLSGYIAPGSLRPGALVMTTAWLSPPNAPVEPGGFDFRRHAWFARIGAVGYTRTPTLVASPTREMTLTTHIFALRMAIADGIRARMQGPPGAFAAAILTGDRSAIDPEQMADLRASNLAHLLAISGLHMGLLTGFVFAALRLGLALSPRIALRLPVKKIAAATALAAGLFYLMLSGASVATQRAFVMAAVALGAVILDRPALTLRAVALAALIVLVLHPVSLLGPGFQMSFAATTALVATYDVLRNWNMPEWLKAPRWLILRWAAGIALTSFVAGAATAPFSAYHFNAVARYGYIANLAAVPVMGLVVMPAAVLAALLTPIGLEGVALKVMSAGISHILNVAEWVATREAALWRIPSGEPMVLPLLTLGALLLCLAKGRLRLSSVPVLLTSLVLWEQSSRPDMLIAANGRMVGVLTEEGRVLSAARGNGFAASVWLENDGSGLDPASAYLGTALSLRANGDVEGDVADRSLIWTASKAPLATRCRNDTIVVAPKWSDRPQGECLVIDESALRTGGAHAIHIGENGRIEIRTVADTSGQRPWTVPAQ